MDVGHTQRLAAGRRRAGRGDRRARSAPRCRWSRRRRTTAARSRSAGATRDGGGEVGVITSVTQPFCGDCTRARLSAEGKLYTCLFADAGHGPARACCATAASDAETRRAHRATSGARATTATRSCGRRRRRTLPTHRDVVHRRLRRNCSPHDAPRPPTTRRGIRHALPHRRGRPRADGRRVREGRHGARGDGARAHRHAARDAGADPVERRCRRATCSRSRRSPAIMAAKRTHELIPHVPPAAAHRHRRRADAERSARSCVEIEATVRTTGKTGVEMEALTAVTRRGADGLRHVQGRRARDAHRAGAARAEVRRQVGRVDGAIDRCARQATVPIQVGAQPGPSGTPGSPRRGPVFVTTLR